MKRKKYGLNRKMKGSENMDREDLSITISEIKIEL